MFSLLACNKIFAINILINIAESETCTILFILLSQEISRKKSVEKDKLADFILSRVLNTNNILVGLTTLLSKIILRCI